MRMDNYKVKTIVVVPPHSVVSVITALNVFDNYCINDFHIFTCTVKLAHAVTSIKQLPVLKGHLCLVIENFI